MVSLRRVIALLLVGLSILFMFSFARCQVSAKVSPSSIQVPMQFPTIQQAIDNATAGATIFVANGTYREHLNINKSVAIVGEDRDMTIIDGEDADYVVSVTAENVSIQGFTITKSVHHLDDGGIRIETSRGVVVSNTNITRTYTGITLYLSTGNVFSNNSILSNAYAITFLLSNDNAFSNNFVSDNVEGVAVYASNNNVFFGNTFSGNGEAVFLSQSTSMNTFFHNNIRDSIRVESGSSNIWNLNGEGNYWGRFNGLDSNGDGIRDEPYVIDDLNQDNYPLVGAFFEYSIVSSGQTFIVTMITNSTISDFGFEIGRETGDKMINFNATDVNGTKGFCRMMIPTSLMDYPFSVHDREDEINVALLPVSNETNAYLYFTYTHDDRSLTVLSSKAMQLYTELLDRYAKLQNDLANYTGRLQTDINGLNVTYQTMLNSLSLILEGLNQLQNSYSALNSSLQQSLANQSESVQNIRSLTYVFAATTAALLIVAVYLSNRVQLNSKPKGHVSEKEE